MYAELLGRGLSARTVLQAHRILNKALNDAVKWEKLLRNPAQATTPPRPVYKQPDMWDLATLQKFRQAASDSPNADYFELAILTGMRRSELSGLMWNALNLVSGKAMVIKTLQRIYGKGLELGQPKTPRSRRSITLSKSAISRLQSVRKRQIEQRLAAGPAWQETGFVFTRLDGRPVDPDFLSHQFQKIVKSANLPHLTLHGLRHAHATFLLQKGTHAKIVSERLGHSSIAVTMDIYSHVLPDMQEAAAQAIDEVLSMPV